VRAGFEILAALDIRRRGPEIVACPTCGRTRIDLFGIVERVEKALANSAAPIKIAVMGCIVNGPGKPARPTSGSRGGRRGGALSEGKVVQTFPE